MFRSLVGTREFCPAIVVLRPWGLPLVYRFFRAFKNRLRGHSDQFARYEAEAIQAVETAVVQHGAAVGGASRRR